MVALDPSQVSQIHRSKATNVVARIERLPISAWHVKARVIIGVATFFDAFDALAIAFVLPVLVPLWKLTGPQIGFMISAGYLGQLAGALLFSWVAQRYGRVTALIWSIVVLSVMSLACAFAWDYQSLLIFRTLQGIGLGGEVPIAAVYISEITKAKGRGRFVLLYELIFPIGLVGAALLGRWVVPNIGWHYMFVIGAVPAILVFFLQRHLPESPRWLATQGRDVEAEAALGYIERETQKALGTSLPPIENVADTDDRRATWSDLFGPIYLRRTLVVWTIWFAAYLITYGLTVWLPTIYRTVFHLPLAQSLQYGLITQVVGLLGTLTCALTIDYFGRRPWFALAFGGAAASLMALWLLGADTPIRVLVFVTTAFFFSSIVSIGAYLYTPELYPTRARAMGVGVATAWLRLASMIGPTVVGLMIGGGLGNVFLAFGVFAAIAAVITAVFAVETKNRVLEEVSP
jgi:putative MFS transporter